MKAPRLGTFITIIIGIFFIITGILHAEDSGNLLQNPSFEDDTTGWQSYGGILTYKNNPVHGGNQAAVLIATEAEACIYQSIPVLAGHTYILSGWTFQNELYEPIISLQICWYEGENGTGIEISQKDSIGMLYYPNNYSFLTTGICTSPANAHSAIVKAIVRIAAPNQPASVYFDDMTFFETISTPTPTPTPTPSPTCGPNLLLTNPGFEEGTANWSTFGGSVGLVESPAQSGTYAVALNSDTVSTIWIYQTVSIQGEENYTFCGYALKNDPNIESVFLRISWYDSEDGFGAELSHNDSLTVLTDNQPLYRLLTTGEVTAPLNAHSARIKAILNPVSQTPAAVYLDNFSFVGPTPTPSPPTTPVPTSTSTPTPEPTQTPTFTPTSTSSPTPTPATTPTPAPEPTPAPTSTPTNEGDIVINEVQYDPPQSGVDYAFEWLEIMNRTSRTIDLSGWEIVDNSEADMIPPLTLLPGGIAVIAARVDFYVNFPSFSGTIVFIADGTIGNGLSNTGDCLVLLDPTGKTIDALSYGDNTTVLSPPCPDVAEGHTLERQPAGLDTNQASDFVDNNAPSPGYSLVLPTPTATPTPTPTLAPEATPTCTPTPEQTAVDTPTPTPIIQTPTTTFMLTPAPKPIPNQSPLSSPGQTNPWSQIKIPAIFFLTGLTILATILLLRK